MNIGLIWIGYGLAVFGAAFGLGDAKAVVAIGIAGAIAAAVSSAFAAMANSDKYRYQRHN